MTAAPAIDRRAAFAATGTTLSDGEDGNSLRALVKRKRAELAAIRNLLWRVIRRPSLARPRVVGQS